GDRSQESGDGPGPVVLAVSCLLAPGSSPFCPADLRARVPHRGPRRRTAVRPAVRETGTTPMTRLAIPTALLAAAAVLAAVPAEAPGCAAAPREDQRVSVSDESALIVWDEATKTEHFIRRARFEATDYDFGFLVPSPNRPQLEEADGTLYDDLSKLTAPKTVYETQEFREEGVFGCADRAARHGAAAGMGEKADPGGVAVLAPKRVGDLDAAVLAFKPGAQLTPEQSAADLLKWLRDNGYAVRPDLLDWIKVYAGQVWVITAFKIAGRPPAPDAEPAPPKEKLPERDR